MHLFNILASLCTGAGLAQATLQIISGGTWTATNTGRHVQAHGAGITKVGSTYYMVGEDKTEGSAFQNINCYSSTNLVEWTHVGALLSRTASGDLGPNRVVERPKVIYNSLTRKYVMYLHIDSSNYGEAKVGVATSDTVCGKYTYIGSWRPLGFESRDIGLFQDDNGSAYLLTEDVSSFSRSGRRRRRRGFAESLLNPPFGAKLTVLVRIAAQRSSHRCALVGLPQHHAERLPLERQHRVSRHPQAQRILLHVWKQTHRLEPKRQRVQLRDIAFGPLVGLADLCAGRVQHVFQPDDLHPSRRRHGHLHGRSLGQHEPHAEHLRLAPADHLGDDHHARGPRQLDPERYRGSVGRRTDGDVLRGRVGRPLWRREEHLVRGVQR